MGSTDEPNRFQHTRVLGVDDVVANTGEGGVAAMGRTAGWGCCGGEMLKRNIFTKARKLSFLEAWLGDQNRLLAP